MMDFLKAYPFITMEQYLWEIPYGKIQIMMNDASRIIHLSEKQIKEYKKIKRTGRRTDKVYNDNNLDEFEAALGI